MKRPATATIRRADGDSIPLELTLLPGDYHDGYEHWAVATRLEHDDRLEVTDLKGGVALHFQNGYLVRAHTGDTALFRSEPL